MTKSMSTLLLDWFALNGRSLPWRVKGGAHPDPYVVLVSEFMLQQTTVKTVIPYFERFMRRFPTIKALAEAAPEEVYACWQGLGYYSRARSLHATAQTIAKRGSFPQNRDEALKLKGIGAYTAASFAALALNQPETVIDGNVIRIICRLYHLTQPVNTIKEDIRIKAETLTDRQNPADYASAIMDLGALICTPKNPQCLLCPWQRFCLSKKQNDMEAVPSRSKMSKKEKNGRVYLIYDDSGRLFIRKRTEKGLLSGLYEFLWTDNEETPPLPQAEDTGLKISHVFTHFKLNLKIYIVKNVPENTDNGFFIRPQDLSAYPFSTLMKKVYSKSQTVFRPAS